MTSFSITDTSSAAGNAVQPRRIMLPPNEDGEREDIGPPSRPFTFRDLLAMFNPLNHIPILNRIVGQDDIHPMARVIGGGIFGGGIFGMVNGIFNHAIAQTAGEDAPPGLAGKAGLPLFVVNTIAQGITGRNLAQEARAALKGDRQPKPDDAANLATLSLPTSYADGFGGSDAPEAASKPTPRPAEVARAESEGVRDTAEAPSLAMPGTYASDFANAFAAAPPAAMPPMAAAPAPRPVASQAAAPEVAPRAAPRAVLSASAAPATGPKTLAYYQAHPVSPALTMDAPRAAAASRSAPTAIAQPNRALPAAEPAVDAWFAQRMLDGLDRYRGMARSERSSGALNLYQ